MPDALTLRRTHPDHESYATLYEHPRVGKVNVGRIALRSGNPVDTPAWSWSIGISSRPGRGTSGTATTKRAAIEAWKHHWPKFRDALTDADWHDVKAEQDYSAKRLMIIDARKLPLTSEQRAELDAEGKRPGPAPHWLTNLVKS